MKFLSRIKYDRYPDLTSVYVTIEKLGVIENSNTH
ncbi:hypothetical protein H1P_1340012 [Hyella patelloides LEGE 07179]|uniref:Uncharacterized protein n=1 Tax=Hyella patelloides LEGE 07179 TaxID=945734 RepID=A0A563VL18_9CYAN|nr:hypothetical protein H1P_1340012 [Hyella patelloides LEGE 07179]